MLQESTSDVRLGKDVDNMKKFGFQAAIIAATLVNGPAYAADEDLIVLDWAGFEDPGFYGAYIEKHGERPTFVLFGEEEEAFQKLRAGFRADVSHPCLQSVDKWLDAGLIEPLDTSRIDRWDDVNQDVKEAFRFDGEYYLLPMEWGTTAVTYRSDLVDEADVQSLQVFLDPKFEGRTSIADNVDDAYALAFLATGVTDWTSATPDDVEKASAWLREAHKNARTYWVDGAELSQLMASGEVLLAWAWNETFVRMVLEGYAVKANRNTVEGSSKWFCGYVNLANAPNPEDKIYDFFNAWLEPESARYLVEEWGYGHSNQIAMSDLGQEALDAVGLGAVSVPLLDQVPMSHEIRGLMIQEFELIKAGF